MKPVKSAAPGRPIWKLMNAFALFVAFSVGTAVAQSDSSMRPKSEDLLPETTVLYIQIENVRDLVEKMGDSNFGRMLADERMAPLVSELYQQAVDAYANEAEETVGLSMDEILSLPSGELCFAVVAPKRKRPVVAFIIDTDPENEAVTKALERGREFAMEQGAEADEEETDEIVFEKMKNGDQQITIFQKDGTLVGATNEDVLKDIWERWNERPVEKIRPLSQNRKFVTIMNRCRGTKESPPEMRAFVDPIAFAKSATIGDFTSQAALNFLPVLGLDGLLGIGGSVLLNEQEFESVFHGHVLLSSPRNGLFDMIALKPADYQPQSWVPHDSVNYMTTSWDIQTMYAELEKIVDAFSSEGTFQEQVQTQINDEIGIDLKADVIDQLTGRVTYVQWNIPPSRINSTANIVGIEVNDSEKAKEMIDVFLGKIEEEEGEGTIEQADYKGQAYWKMPDEDAEEQLNRIRESDVLSVEIRATQPCFAIIGDHLIICDHPDALKRIIDTDRGDEPALVDDDQFRTVTSKMTRLLGSDMPSALFFSRPAEQIKLWMDIANNDDSRDYLEQTGEENAYVRGIVRALEENPLPDFEEIRHYFPAQGTFITDDETGYHMLAFSLKAEEKPVSDED